jgi:hypothetical protein
MHKKEMAKIENIGTEIDRIVNECLPITTKQAQGFNQALVLAKGIKTIREHFLANPEIKENILAMKDTALGFMTDRSPAALEKNNNLKPYTYEQVVECCIEAMMQGYRLTGNEFNMIAGRFYGAKNGKFRKIIENEKITNFFFTTTSPMFDQEERVNYGKKAFVPIAKVQCFATWSQDGTPVKLGYEDDKLVFKIKVNAMMGDDGVTGKALSKLFTRVLMRIEGNILPDATDIDEEPAAYIPEKTMADEFKEPEMKTQSKTKSTIESMKEKSPIAFEIVEKEIGFPKDVDSFEKFCIRFDEVCDS